MGPTLNDGTLGNLISDRKGTASIHTFKDFKLKDIEGMSVVLRGSENDLFSFT